MEKHPAAVNNDTITPYTSHAHPSSLDKSEILEEREVFHDDGDHVKFRTVSWQRATIIFLKIQFAMSILAVPGALATLGAVGGGISIVGWAALNTYTAVLLGGFHNRHPECHSMFNSKANGGYVANGGRHSFGRHVRSHLGSGRQGACQLADLGRSNVGIVNIYN